MPQLNNENEIKRLWRKKLACDGWFFPFFSSMCTQTPFNYNFNRNSIKFIVMYDVDRLTKKYMPGICATQCAMYVQIVSVLNTHIDWNEIINNWYERMNGSTVHRSVWYDILLTFQSFSRRSHRRRCQSIFLLASIRPSRTHSFYGNCHFKHLNHHGFDLWLNKCCLLTFKSTWSKTNVKLSTKYVRSLNVWINIFSHWFFHLYFISWCYSHIVETANCIYKSTSNWIETRNTNTKPLEQTEREREEWEDMLLAFLSDSTVL